MVRMRYSKAFTLIELLVVISIVGVLSSVVLVSLGGVRVKGTVVAGRSFEKQLYRALSDHVVLEYKIDDAVCGPNLTSIPDSGPYDKDINTINGAGGIICPVVDTQLYNKKSLYIGSGKQANAYHSPFPANYFSNTINQSNITASFWIKTLSSSINIFAINGSVLRVQVDSSGKIGIYSAQNESSVPLICTSDQAINDGQWHHIAVSISSNNNFTKIFKDGKKNGQCNAPTLYSNAFNSWDYIFFVPRFSNSSGDFYIVDPVVFDESV